MKTERLAADENGISRAAQLLKEGKLVAIPTETVYGLAANALDGRVVKEIYEAKGRPQDNPLIVHIAKWQDINQLAIDIPECAARLAEAFWPGPLTLVLQKSNMIPAEVSGGLDTVAIRMPSHPVARSIIEKSGVPLAAPSANLSGSPSPTTVNHVLQDLDGRIAAVVDGGNSDVGVESTVLSLAGEKPVLLRPGFVTLEQLRAILGDVETASAVTQKLRDGEHAASPGMKYKHYAPKTNITLIRGDTDHFIDYVNTLEPLEYSVLCFDGEEKLIHLPYVTYGRADAPEAQAQQLFEALRKLDELGRKKAIAHCPSPQGIGLAVYNRLIRAAAFRILTLNDGEKRRLTVGLTGPTGSGKSTAAYAFAGQGCAIIDADLVARQAVAPGSECLIRLAEAFDQDIIDERGRLDRRLLASRAFATKEGQQLLNSITHPAVIELIKQQREELFVGGYDIIILDAPLLFESHADELCDTTVAVLAKKELRRARIMERDNLSEAEAERRISAQQDDNFYISNSDHVLYNEQGKDSLYQNALCVLKEIKEAFFHETRCSTKG